MNIKYRLAAAVVALMTVAVTFATDIACTPGTLAARLGDAAATTATLRLSGSVDASDLFFIDDNMPALRTLDLSEVTVAAYVGAPLRGNSRYAAATIPTGALAGAPLTALTLPATAVTLGDMCFSGTKLTTLTVPQSVTFGQGAFAGCPALQSVTLYTAGTGDYTFAECSALRTVALRGTTNAGAHSFAGCTALSTIAGSDALTAIGAGAFAGCTSLQVFNFGTSLATIGDRAFTGSGLQYADLAANRTLRSVGAHAFADCADLAEATFGSSPAFGEGAFMCCRSLRTIDMGGDVTIVPDYAFASSGIADDTGMLPPSTTAVGDYAYSGSRAESVALPSTLTSLGNGAMENMTELTLIDGSMLTDVPALGNDVWQGVDQPHVELSVNPDMTDAFRTADQWQNFNIQGMSTANPAITITTGLRGRIADNILYIESSDKDISTVTVYDIDGAILAARTVDGTAASIDLSAVSAPALIVHCVLADNTAATLKLLR